MAYREKGERIDVPVDDGELAAIRIRETEETKRKADELRAEAAKDRRAKLATFFGYDGFMLILGLLSCTVVGSICAIAIMYFHAQLYRR